MSAGSVQSQMNTHALSTSLSSCWEEMDYLTQEQVSTLAAAYAPKSQHPDEIRVASLRFDRALNRLLASMSHTTLGQEAGDLHAAQETTLGETQPPSSEGN